jgi:hypothetical protein
MPQDLPRMTRFTVVAQRDPGLLIRILNLFALRDHVPARVSARTVGGEWEVRIGAGRLCPREAEVITAKMRALVGVVSVRRA